MQPAEEQKGPVSVRPKQEIDLSSVKRSGSYDEFEQQFTKGMKTSHNNRKAQQFGKGKKRGNKVGGAIESPKTSMEK